jgi:hypothetical protein
MADATPCRRSAYVRTCSSPPWSPRHTYKRTREEYTQFLEEYIRQPSHLATDPNIPRHYFHFTLFTPDDLHICSQLLSSFPQPPQIRWNPWFLRDVCMSDIEVHTSIAHAKSPDGSRMLARCQEVGFKTSVHGAENGDCDEELLQECDYLVDLHHSAHQDRNWFWQHARPGIREDNMLTNPKYSTAKHDISALGLAGRTHFSVWSNTSGCFHGNYEWHCGGCGGKCKRGRCKVNPRPEREVPVWGRLPVKGSKDWRELTASDVCWRYQFQNNHGMTPGKYTSCRDDWSSVDTFSGD